MMTDKDYNNTPLWNEQRVETVTDPLLQLLNDVVRQHNLSSTDVLASLAQLSAAHIHVMQGFFDNPDQKDTVESVYYKMLQHFLAAFDVRDIQYKMEKIKREKMN